MATSEILNSFKALTRSIFPIDLHKSLSELDSNNSFTIQNSRTTKLEKLEQRLTSLPSDYEGINQILALTKDFEHASQISKVIPYIHEPKTEELFKTFQEPLLDFNTIQKSIHTLVAIQPATLALENIPQLAAAKTAIAPIRQGIETALAETVAPLTSPQNILLASSAAVLSATGAGPYLAAMASGALIPSTVTSTIKTYDAFSQGDVVEGSRQLTHTLIQGAGLYGGLELTFRATTPHPLRHQAPEIQNIEAYLPETSLMPRLELRSPVPENPLMHQLYKRDLREVMEKPVVENSDLKNIVNALYRPDAEYGNGSTAAATRYEKLSGLPIKEKWHSTKAQERIIGLKKWLNNNSDASSHDKSIAESLLLDLKDSLK